MTVRDDEENTVAETTAAQFEVPPPLWRTFEDFLAGAPMREIRYWCGRKAVRANRDRLMSGRPKERITTDDVMSVLTAARGACSHCGSLAVEGAPMHPETRKPMPWAHIGRRIGSLDHIVARFDGGPNTVDNLRWSCHWCNTWPSERIPGAMDRGAIHPDSASSPQQLAGRGQLVGDTQRTG